MTFQLRVWSSFDKSFTFTTPMTLIQRSWSRVFARQCTFSKSALAGAHVATIPFNVIQKLAQHPLTDIGLRKFLADWEKCRAKLYRHVSVYTAFRMASGVAGSDNSMGSAPSPKAIIPLRNAVTTEIASINGGSPTALLPPTTFDLARFPVDLRANPEAHHRLQEFCRCSVRE